MRRTIAADVFLRPGQIWFGGGAMRVRTILGSCVAITLWHPQRRIGGICHYLLPRRPIGDSGVPDGLYATDAIGGLLREVAAVGARPAEFEAKLFGGGRMFGGARAEDVESRSVQARNIEIARTLLAQHGVRIHAEHLGGRGHREVVFDVATGDAWLKHALLQEREAG